MNSTDSGRNTDNDNDTESKKESERLVGREPVTSARDEILARLESARPPASPEPAAMTPPGMPLDPIACLRDRLAEAGGTLQTADRKDWPTQIAWPVDVASLEHVYSSLAAFPISLSA